MVDPSGNHQQIIFRDFMLKHFDDEEMEEGRVEKCPNLAHRAATDSAPFSFAQD